MPEHQISSPSNFLENFEIAIVSSAELISERGIMENLMQMTETLGKCGNAELQTDAMDLTIDFKQREGKRKSWIFRSGAQEPVSNKCFADRPGSGGVCELNWLTLCIGVMVCN
jgi:hypothetical protein